MTHCQVKLSKKMSTCCKEFIERWPKDEWWKKDTTRSGSVDYKICAEKEIGRGGFGTVYKGHEQIFIQKKPHCSEIPLAIKIVTFEEEDRQQASATSGGSGLRPTKQKLTSTEAKTLRKFSNCKNEAIDKMSTC